MSTGVHREVELREENGGYVLYRNGAPFEIRGVAGHQHLHELREMGGNTIRVYDTTNLGAILDSAHAHGLAVIVGLWMMGDKEMDYTDTFKVEQQYRDIRKSIRRYKDHPAVLMWCLGNEISYRVKWQELLFPKEAWLAFEDLVDMIHEEDPDHPVTTTITNFQKKRLLYLKLHVPQLDIIGINTFGRLPGLAEEANLYRWFFDEPYFLAEWAIQGPWESPESSWYTPTEPPSSEKARLYRKYYQEYIPHDDPNFLGSCVFYWGQKQEHTHTWFGLFSEEGERSQMLESLQITWTHSTPQNYVPRVDSLLIDGLSSEDTLLFRPGQRASAHLFLHDPEGDSLHTEWEILPDVWHFDYRAINQKPKPVEGLIKVRGLRDARFVAPAEPGVYRLFAKVTDPGRNMYATANTAFMVME